MAMMKTMLLGVGMLALVTVGCGSDPTQGPQGEQGRAGAVGAVGTQGPAGAKGEPGTAGKDGAPGKDGAESAVSSSGSRLRARCLLGDDGSREFAGWFDMTTGQTCVYSSATDGQRRCLPAQVGGAGVYFEDAACASPVFLLSSPDGTQPSAPPAYVRSLSGGMERYLKIGANTPAPSTLFLMSAGQCVVAPPEDPAKVFFYVTDELPPSTFVAATLTTD
jgi:hypothetical protein